jgi:hypothetical protein
MNGPRLYLGIDPGVSGGLACIDANGKPFEVIKMPDSEADLWRWLLKMGVDSLDEFGNCQVVAVLERVRASRVMSQSASFTFGEGYGRLRMALIAAEVPFEEVTPNVWQKEIGILQKTGARDIAIKKDKNISKRKAEELFPSLTGTHWNSDALLLAEYCRRQRVGLLRKAS